MQCYAHPLMLNVEWHNIYLESGFSYVGQALKKMNLLDLVTIKEDYCPF
jgi:hypothetical protein